MKRRTVQAAKLRWFLLGAMSYSAAERSHAASSHRSRALVLAMSCVVSRHDARPPTRQSTGLAFGEPVTFTLAKQGTRAFTAEASGASQKPLDGAGKKK